MSDIDDLDTISEEDSEEIEPMTVQEWLVDFLKAWGPALLVVLLIRASVAEPFRIPSGSMVPTLAIGDHILVTKYSYGFRIPLTRIPLGKLSAPERGDVVVFVKPNPSQNDAAKLFDFPFPPFATEDYVKRVVGLPGDRIAVRNNIVYINGKPQSKSSLGDFTFTNHGCRSSKTTHFEETFDGKAHSILNNHYGLHVSNYTEQTVPDGHVFMMGDNRDNSSDSRSWGFVPLRNIKGKARFIWLSLKKCGSTNVFGEVRGERFGLTVK